ncbi:MAG: hypothetical protein MRZ79_01285 [Bacteroidia bacterium]|nr:hypothetical protein [Bacteroidia bacterium]
MKSLFLLPILLLSTAFAQQKLIHTPKFHHKSEHFDLAKKLSDSLYQYKYYPNGQVKHKFTKAFATGTWEGYFENGKPRYKLEFKDRRRDGWQTWWDRNGDTLFHYTIKENMYNNHGADSIVHAEFKLLKAEADPKDIGELRRKLKYPQILRDAGISGRMLHAFKVSKEGKVIDYRTLSGIHPIVDQIYLLELLDLTFDPAIGYDDKPVDSWVKIPNSFFIID